MTQSNKSAIWGTHDSETTYRNPIRSVRFGTDLLGFPRLSRSQSKWLLTPSRMIPVKFSRIQCLFLLAGTAGLFQTGCVSPLNTRFPQPFIFDQRAEALSYRFHDPFPDSSIGPGIGIRPPSFKTQRDPARRAAENRMLRGYNVQQAPTGSLPPKTSWDYPDSVQTE